jgi:hypothetical protein
VTTPHALRAAGATFARGQDVLVPPFSLDLDVGRHAQLDMPTTYAASIAARMAAGIVKATCGTLFIGDFDPRIQPVQAKRLAGFVPRGGRFGGNGRLTWFSLSRAGAAPNDRREVVELHAALHEVPSQEALSRVRSVLGLLARDDDVAFALALALIRPISLLVVDQPPPDVARLIPEIVPAGTAALIIASSVTPITAAPSLVRLAR